MRTLGIAIAAAILGIAVGVGTTWARLGQAPDFSARFDTLISAVPETDKAPQPIVGAQPSVVVDAEEHDFGIVERHHVVEHSFRFTNRGDAPLQLKSGGTTCMKCTVSKIPGSPIPPGQSADVVVQYNASIESPQFRQTANILTNDPLTPRVGLVVFGKISESYSIVPRELVFSKLAVNATEKATVRLISFLTDKFTIESHQWSDGDAADYLDVQIAPIPSEELTEPQAQCGFAVTVTVKPGLPLGVLHEKLVLNTDLPNAKTIEIPIEGTVTSDITLSGQGWDREHNVLVLGVVRSSEGLKRNLWVLVHGEHRHDVQITVGKCEPEFLQATLGSPADVHGGAVLRIPLTLEIPPGTPDANYLGSPGKLGQVILETTHPDAKQVRLLVQVAVEK